MPQSPTFPWLTERPVAHRGLHAAGTERVENSLPAIAAAVAANVAIEIDLQATKDGHAVVFHDYTLERLTNRMGLIKNHSLADLKTIAITGSNSRIAALEDVLTLVAGKVPIFLELKVPREEKKPAALAKSIAPILKNYTGPIAVMSFHPLTIKWFTKNMPNLCRGMVLEANHKWWHMMQGWRRSRYCSIAKPHFVAHSVKDLPDRFTQRWRNSGGPLLTWTVRSKQDVLIAARYADQAIFEDPIDVDQVLSPSETL